MVGLVIVFSLLPGSSPPLRAMFHINDKLEHIAAYAALTFLPSLHEKPRALVRIGLAMMAMGVALEFGQLLSEGREFEVADMLADGLGLLAGMVIGLASRFWIHHSGFFESNLPET